VRKDFCDAYSIFREWGDGHGKRLVMRIMCAEGRKPSMKSRIIVVDIVGAAAPSRTTWL
jgi:hypothetical protein